MGQYVDEFSKLAHYAPDDVATDAAKQEKFMEGLNDEMSMQLMVATFNNYQELVDKALMMKGSSSRLRAAKGSMDKGSTIQELSRSLVLPRSREDTPITMEAIPTMEEVRITTVAPRMEMGMEQAATRTALTQPHPQRRTKVTLLVSSAERLDTMPMSVLKQIMEMAIEALGRSPTLSTGDK